MEEPVEKFMREYPRGADEDLVDYLERFWTWLENEGGWCVYSALHQDVTKERDEYRGALEKIAGIAAVVELNKIL